MDLSALLAACPLVAILLLQFIAQPALATLARGIITGYWSLI